MMINVMMNVKVIFKVRMWLSYFVLVAYMIYMQVISIITNYTYGYSITFGD